MSDYGPYHAHVEAVHDGDTMTLQLDMGFDLSLRAHCRVFGINAPELRTQAGKDARVFALTVCRPGDAVMVVSHGYDKYGGRFDGTITLTDGRDFAQVMIAAGQAVVMP